MERRKSKRSQIQIDIEISHPGTERCWGYADNISYDGVSVVLSKGSLPSEQRSVILSFRVWTGSEMLYRKLYAHVVRSTPDRVALEFADADFVADAVVQDLIFYQQLEHRTTSRCVRIPTDSAFVD